MKRFKTPKKSKTIQSEGINIGITSFRDGQFGRLALSIEKMYKEIQRKHDRKECVCYRPRAGASRAGDRQTTQVVDVILGVEEGLI